MNCRCVFPKEPIEKGGGLLVNPITNITIHIVAIADCPYSWERLSLDVHVYLVT